MKTITKIILTALGLLALPLITFSSQITVPSALSAGYALVSTSTGAYIATTTEPFHVGAIYATSTNILNYFNSAISAPCFSNDNFSSCLNNNVAGIQNLDGSIVVNSSSGIYTLSLNTANANSWTAPQTFSGSLTNGIRVGSVELYEPVTATLRVIGTLNATSGFSGDGSLITSVPINSGTTGTLTVNRGGTGQTAFGQGWLNSDGTTITSSTSPTVNYITSTSTTATSTFGYGINLSSKGCFAIGGTCITSGGGTVNSGVFGQATYYGANGTAVSGTSSLVIGTTTKSIGNIGIGSTSPTLGSLDIETNAANTSYSTIYASSSLSTFDGAKVLSLNANGSEIFSVIPRANPAFPYITDIRMGAIDNNVVGGSYIRLFGPGGSTMLRYDINASQVFVNGALFPQGAMTMTRLADATAPTNQFGTNPLQFQDSLWNGAANSVLQEVAGYVSPTVAGLGGIRLTTTLISGVQTNNLILLNTGDSYFSGGNLGIGTSSPYASTSIQSNASIGDAFVVATSSKNTIGGYDNDGHRFTSGPAPAISTCGTGPGSVVGDDQSGTITTATAATACTMTFSKAYRNTPTCTVSDNSTVGFADISSISTSAVTFGISSALTGGNLFYSCTYHK